MIRWTVLHLRHRLHKSRHFGMLGFCAVAISVSGCPYAGLPDSATFSPTETVTLGVGVTKEALLGAGAPSMADSTWALYRADDDTLLFRVIFGVDGQVERLIDSFVFAREWLGSEIIVDTQTHPTDFPGGAYVSGAYTAELDGNVGVLGVIHGLLFGAHLGTATLSFSGCVLEDRIDGPLIRTVTIFAETPFPAPGNAEFEVYALKEN